MLTNSNTTSCLRPVTLRDEDTFACKSASSSRKGVPSGLALVIVITIALGVGLGIFALVGSSVIDFRTNLPEYKTSLNTSYNATIEWIEAKTPINIDKDSFAKYLAPEKALGFMGGVLAGFGSALTNAFFILLTMIFILLEWTIFEDKIRIIYKGEPKRIDRIYTMIDKVRRYMALKTCVSLITGAFVFICLWIIGVDYPLMWALLAFAFNFIPAIGSIIAAVPAVAMAIVQPELGIWPITWTVICYVVVNMVIGNVVEPKVMGRDLGLSTLVVFLSLVFWGWVFGPVGMFLSVPLTVTAKIMLESADETRWLAVLLGSGTTNEDVSTT